LYVCPGQTAFEVIVVRSREEKRHPIQVVARRTGLSADVLRAWEKRYGILKPARSDGGRRLYADDDVEYLRLLRRATAAGRSVGQLVGLSRGELEALVREDDAAAASGPVPPGHEAELAPLVAEALTATEALDAAQLDAILRRAMLESEAARFLDDVVVALLSNIGLRWARDQFSPAHEHLASAVLRGLLTQFIATFTSKPDAPGLVSATLTGQRHEFGAMLVAATAASLGWRVTYLGADLPAAAIASAARQAEAAVVALSFVHPSDDPSMAGALHDLRAALPAHVVLLAGGGCVEAYTDALGEVRAIVVHDLPRLRSMLTSLVGERTPRR
jgi:DNA-binding transcriptional MerR regulator/methylmalonyl-CoA mutase cobalamin-binding subunit